MRRILVTPQFKKDIRKVPKKVIAKANHLLNMLKSDPMSPTIDVRKLSGIKAKVWRVRVGQYRIIYSFDRASVILHRFRHRKNIYRKW